MVGHLFCHAERRVSSGHFKEFLVALVEGEDENGGDEKLKISHRERLLGDRVREEQKTCREIIESQR